MKIAFFDTKPYDKPSFEKVGEQFGIKFKYFETKLNEDTVELAHGYDGVCVFVNDTVNAKVIDSLQSYYDISMELLSGEYRDLFNKENPVYTKVRDDMPAIYGICSKATNSLVADGCVIKGTVENSILFRGVYVAEGAVVKNSIVMQDSYISQNAKVSYSILDKNVVVKPCKEISGADTYPLYIGKDITV